MPFIKPNMWSFYAEGREDRLIRADLDVLEKVTKSDMPFLQACRAIATEYVTPLKTGRVKRKWMDDHADAFKETATEHGSCNQEDAYDAWLEGRLDKLTLKLQKRCSDEILDQFVVYDSDDDDEEEDDDEDDEDGDD